jgi:alpha-amylase/alpha-mannosidase (GH57 family)
MTERYICIHGHFYQPPRENAWLEFVELQDSAYPFHDWNERVTAECYAPNGMSRILDGSQSIVKITNNYAYISFNFGPTLLAWMADKEPETYRTILEADQESRKRFSGHGNAIAQAYNHTIVPLCNTRDKYTQIYWGIRDFEFRFGRKPEGLWLPETAVDIETLEILVRLGVRFTILSPYQAKQARKIRARTWKDVSDGNIDPSMPYEVRLPSGKRITAFFYDGPISRAIAFERLLDKGEFLSGRLMSAFSDERTWPQIVHIATDGETYGHHHKKGDMALAYALHHIETNNPGMITNYGEYLERHPPTHQVELWERSSWSCAHGVERWNSNCGCNSGGFPDWNQEWRMPLRHAFDWLRDSVASFFDTKGRELFRDPWNARNEYIHVILNRSSDNVDRFFNKHATRTLTQKEKTRALKLMEMQRHAMLMYTSCGWFFDELSGIETTQVIQYAARTVQLFEEISGESIEPTFLDRLAAAKSNIPEHQDGRVIYEKFVKPARVDPKKVAAHYGLMSLVEPRPEETKVYCYKVHLADSERIESGTAKLVIGRANITSEITQKSEDLSFAALHTGDHLMNCGVRLYENEKDYELLKQEMIEPFNRADFSEVTRILNRHFGETTYSLGSIFHDDQRKLLDVILKSTLDEAEEVYRHVYETHAPMMRFLSDLRIPLPREFSIAAEFALGSNLREAMEAVDKLDATRIQHLIDEAKEQGLSLDGATLGFALRKTIKKLSEQLLADPDNIDVMKTLEEATGIARNLPFEVNVWKAQNNFYQLLQKIYPKRLEKALQGDAASGEWIEHFVLLGQNLAVKVDRAAAPQLQQAS